MQSPPNQALRSEYLRCLATTQNFGRFHQPFPNPGIKDIRHLGIKVPDHNVHGQGRGRSGDARDRGAGRRGAFLKLRALGHNCESAHQVMYLYNKGTDTFCNAVFSGFEDDTISGKQGIQITVMFKDRACSEGFRGRGFRNDKWTIDDDNRPPSYVNLLPFTQLKLSSLNLIS